MLYKKNETPQLDRALFAAPTAEYRGAPFWAWNTQLEKDELLRQIDVFDEMGIGGFHMHSRSGMATSYLSDEFMDLVTACCEHAKKKNMLCWLYDEDRWPSGAAGGIITKDVRYRQRTLVLETSDPRTRDGAISDSKAAYLAALERGEKPHGYMVCRYNVQIDAEGYLTHYEMLPGGDGAADFYCFVRIAGASAWYNGEAYLDTLSPAAVQRFIEVTYDRYYETVGAEFGKTIPAIFTDEPQFARRQFYRISTERGAMSFPWTDDFEESYTAAYGESLLARLPELIWELPDGKLSTARYRFADHLCERFTTAFADPIGKWCEEHGIAFTGHMMEEPTLQSQSSAIGEAMRAYRAFQIPGMDLLCGRMEFTTAKQVASAVHQYGREGMLSELYGVTGWDYDFRSHKEQGDWQAALGVTVRVHHLTWVSMNGEAKRDYPASIGYQSPWYQKYSAVEDHFARLNTALTRGKPSVRIGMIHPIESYWMHCGPSDKTAARRAYLDGQFQSVTNALLYAGLDFDFISESLLPEQCPTAGNPLRVGEMAYDVIVVPVMETMRATTLARLQDFAAAGGEVILMGSAPFMIDAVPSDAAEKAAASWTKLDVDNNALIDALSPYRFVDLLDLDAACRSGSFVHQVRDDGDGKWIFICHGAPVEKNVLYMPGQNCENLRITLRGRWKIEEYDTLSGEVHTPAYRVEGDKTVLDRAFYAADSLLLRLTPYAGADFVEKAADTVRALPRKSAPRKIADLVDYTLEEPNALLLDRAAWAFDGEAYADEMDSIRVADIGRSRFYRGHEGQRTVQPWVPMPEAVAGLPSHTVKRRFTFTAEIAVSGAHLALEMPDGAKIWLNGAEIPVQADGWYVDRCIQTVALPEILPGEVVIEIEQPFSLRSCTEWCYLLGDFGVRLCGKYATIVKRAEKLAFGDITTQTLPFYTGNLVYHCTVESTGEADAVLRCARFGGALFSVSVDGGAEKLCPYPPYCVSLGQLSAGTHRVDIRLYGTRQNGFGALHNCVPGFHYWGPASWRTEGAGWTDAYMLRPAGLLNAPEIW